MKLTKFRLEALSDGVIAIIITIMIFNIPLPKEINFNSIINLLGTILMYFFSFVVVGDFWSRHHMTFSYIEKVSSAVIWYNFLFLFFLSMIPLFTKFVIENLNNIAAALCYDITYIGVTVAHMFIFRYIIKNSENEHLTQMRQKRKEALSGEKFEFFHGNFMKRFYVTIILIVAIIAVSILLKFSSYILLGIPVLFSAFNLIFVRHQHETHDNSDDIEE